MVVISRISAAAMAMRLSHPHAFVALVCFFLAGACLFREKKERKKESLRIILSLPVTC